MGNSLQDQLLALGLAKEKPGKPAAQKARPGSNRQPGKPGNPGPGKTATPAERRARQAAKIPPQRISPENISLEQAYRIREQEEKSARQRARELKIEEDRKRAAVNKQIREIIATGRLNLADAGEARYFMYKERIRKVYASAAQLAGLNDGSLGVVYLAGGYHILSAENTEKVRQISAEHVADLLSGAGDDDEFWAACEQTEDHTGDSEASQEKGRPEGER